MRKNSIIVVNSFLIMLLSFSIPVFAGDILDNTINKLEEERIISNEESAHARLKVIQTAFECYYFDHSNTYPKNLSELTTGKLPYIPTYPPIDADGVWTVQGYKYKIVDSSKDFYLIVAYPDSSLPTRFSGRYSFCIMKDGIIRQASQSTNIDSYEIAKTLKAVEQ